MTSRYKLAAISVVALVLLLPLDVEAAPSRQDVQSQLDKLSKQISVLDEEFNVARIELAKVESRVRVARHDKTQADTQLSELGDVASRRAAALYRAGPPDYVLAFFTSSNPSQLSRRLAAVKRVNRWESALGDSLKIAGEDADASAAALETQRIRAKSARDAIELKRKGLVSAIADQKRLLDKIVAQETAAARVARVTRQRAAKVVPPVPNDVAASPRARIALETAYAQIGKPYRWGAAGPDSFDCSGLTMYSWAKAGVSLPHSSRAQFSSTPRVSREALQPGDLVFFGSPIHHVGMYVGNNNMINSPETGDFVGIRSMQRRDYVGAGRPGV
ncbi:MAG: NlpC/P60 family protein [Actinomycetota bacterium]